MSNPADYVGALDANRAAQLRFMMKPEVTGSPWALAFGGQSSGTSSGSPQPSVTYTFNTPTTVNNPENKFPEIKYTQPAVQAAAPVAAPVKEAPKKPEPKPAPPPKKDRVWDPVSGQWHEVDPGGSAYQSSSGIAGGGPIGQHPSTGIGAPTPGGARIPNVNDVWMNQPRIGIF